MHVQVECRHPLAQFRQKPLGVSSVLETDDCVVSISHHDHCAARVASPPLLDPEIVGVVEIDVRQQRRDDRPLRGAPLCGVTHTVLHHANLQPFTDQAQHAPVADSVFQEPHHPLVVDGVEETPDVGVQYPVHRLVLDADCERVQRIVLSPSGSEPVGEAEEVRFVDRIQNLHHCALDNLIFQRRDPQRSLPPVGFRDVGAA